MKDIINALQIFNTYENVEIAAEHDEIIVWIRMGEISDEDRAKLEGFSWYWSDDYQGYRHFV